MSRTPSDDLDALLRRTVDAAEYLFLLGDTARARTLLSRGLDAAPPGPARVPGLLLAATIASWERGDATVAHWCHQAMTEAGDDVLLRARCHATLADTSPSGAAAGPVPRGARGGAAGGDGRATGRTCWPTR